ncbi:Histone acetyltransferase type B subunit [Entamoeba marina]
MEEDNNEAAANEAAALQAIQEYETWKVNAIYLYDFLTTHETSFPYSTTVDWGNIIKTTPTVSYQNIIYGTNEFNEMSYVIRSSVAIPTNPKPSAFSDGNVGDFVCDDRVNDVDFLPHKGDVRRCRAMPQNRDIVATTSSDGNCYVYNFNNQSTTPTIRSPGGGFGLSWSPVMSGNFAVCVDGKVHVFNIDQNENGNTGTSFNLHDAVNDVSWSSSSMTFLSVGEDSKAIVTDVRGVEKAIIFENTHEGDANACYFDNTNSDIFITGGGVDGLVRFWDIRRPGLELCHLQGACDGINYCALSNISSGFVVSASKDSKVRLYDMSKVGEDQTSNDADDGGSEFLFAHSGHLNEVFDSIWNPLFPHVIASAGDGRDIQIWQPSKSLLVEDRKILRPTFLK